ncbi:50S ribosomal protein L21 [bacterium]|jgi:large subunit ribosomal protein L21|nr:50S ribosomal protein L21 [bacterium]
MFAVIESGSKQFLIEKDTIIEIEKIEGEENSEITFENVLLVNDGEKTNVGTPNVKGASVKGVILEQKRDKKITVFKFKKKTGYQKKQGHRQSLTKVKIVDVLTK